MYKTRLACLVKSVKMSEDFPPQKISFLDNLSASNFVRLSETLNKNPINLFLGAGISASAGLPTWIELLNKICSTFFYHWEFGLKHERFSLERPPQNLSIAFWESFMWSKSSIETAKMAVNNDIVLLAQQIKNCIRPIDWRYLVNKSLYGNGDTIHYSPLLEAISNLCNHSVLVNSIINTNYDSLLEPYLEEKDIEFSIIWDANCKSYGIPIYHPHGYLKFGGGPKTEIVLSENDYLKFSNEPFFWANQIMLNNLSNSNAVFIGHSFSDPNIRRLVRTASNMSTDKIFVFLPKTRNPTKQEKMLDTLFDNDLIQSGVFPIRYPLLDTATDKHGKLVELVKLLDSLYDEKQTLWSNK